MNPSLIVLSCFVTWCMISLHKILELLDWISRVWKHENEVYVCTKPVDEILLYNFTVISKYLAFRGSYSSSKPVRLISASQRSVSASLRPKTNILCWFLPFFYFSTTLSALCPTDCCMTKCTLLYLASLKTSCLDQQQLYWEFLQCFCFSPEGVTHKVASSYNKIIYNPSVPRCVKCQYKLRVYCENMHHKGIPRWPESFPLAFTEVAGSVSPIEPYSGVS